MKRSAAAADRVVIAVPNGPSRADGDGFVDAAASKPEAGWMRSEIGTRRLFAKRNPCVPWIPVILRGVQGLFSLVSFAVVASMNHPDAMCVSMTQRAETADAGSSEASLARLVDDALCLPGRNYKDFVSLEFLVVVTAAAFAWACLFFALDMVGMGRMEMFRVIRTGAHSLEWAASWGAPRAALIGDVCLCALCFAAACAVAGLRTGRVFLVVLERVV